jgi:beta-lactamase class A
MQFDTVFTAEFLQKVPPMQLTMATQQLTKESGGCVSIRVVDSTSAYQCTAEVVTVNGYTIPVTMSIRRNPPHLIEGLFLKPPMRVGSTLASVIKDLKELKGTTSLSAINLSRKHVLAAHDSSAYMPIGSTFKLYVLGTLAEQIRLGKRRWDDVVVLDTSARSLPSGILQTWPHGSPLTLHTLATLMISQSDNTATDLLMHELHQDSIERMQSRMGHSNASLNIPFLTTRDVFLLKFSNDGQGAHDYAGLRTADRRKYLDRINEQTPLSAVRFVDTAVVPDRVEWFARTTDCIRAMDWLRDGRLSPAVLDILAVNKGLDINSKQWPYAGYKGGSEPGVINMTYLLRHSSGDWYALSASWMNPDNSDSSESGVNEATFAGLVQRAIQLLAP